MIAFTKKSLPIYALSLACYAANAMEQPKQYPQIQLKNHEDITVVTYYAMILEGKLSPIYDSSIRYATKSVHTKLNLPTTINDPLMQFKIIEDINNPTSITFKKVIPLKYTFNLNDGSLLTTVKKTGAQLYPHNPLLKDKQFLVKIMCAKNPILKKTSFAQDRNFAKKEFFEEPHIWIDEKDNYQELIENGIIEKKHTEVMIAFGNHINQERREFDVFKHGLNGIANDEDLRQSIIDEKIVPMRSPLILIASEDDKIIIHKSCFRSLKNRELTGSFGRKI